MPLPFIGREQELLLYDQFLKNDAPWVLLLTAVGGTGKTTLLNAMRARTPANTLVVKLDFTVTDAVDRKPGDDDSVRLPLDPLKHLRSFVNELKKRDAVDEAACSAFDQEAKLATEKYAAQTVNNMQYILARGGSIVKDVNADITMVVDLQTPYLNQRKAVTPAFLKLFEKFAPDHLVVMLDTCEWLNEPANSGVGDWLRGEILFQIHDKLSEQGKRCHIVMAGTVPPRMLDVEQGEQEGWLTRLKLRELNKDVVKQHLETIGMQDPNLREQCYRVTLGNGKCFWIVCDLWQKLREKAAQREAERSDDEEEEGEESEDVELWNQLQKNPVEEEYILKFQQRFCQDAKDRFVDRHILDAPVKTSLKQISLYSALLRRFTLPLLTKVFSDQPELQGDEAQQYYEELTHSPYIDPIENDRYAYRTLRLLREIVAEFLRHQEPDAWKRYHARARDEFTPSSEAFDAPPSPYLVDWYYHSLACSAAHNDYKHTRAEFQEQEKICWDTIFQQAQPHGKNALNALVIAGSDVTLMFTAIAHEAQAYKKQHSV